MAVLTREKTKRTLADFPSYTTAKEKFDKLCENKREADAAIARAFAEKREPPTSRDTVIAKAKAMVTGRPIKKTELPPNIRELQQAVEVADTAVGIQREIVTEERSQASRAICEERKPEHDKLKASIIQLGDDLLEAWQMEAEFIRDLAADGGQGRQHLRRLTFDEIRSFTRVLREHVK